MSSQFPGFNLHILFNPDPRKSCLKVWRIEGLELIFLNMELTCISFVTIPWIMPERWTYTSNHAGHLTPPRWRHWYLVRICILWTCSALYMLFLLKGWWVGAEGDLRLHLRPLPKEDLWSEWVPALDQRGNSYSRQLFILSCDNSSPTPAVSHKPIIFHDVVMNNDLPHWMYPKSMW